MGTASTPRSGPDGRPAAPRSHLLPRSRRGRLILLLFLVLFALGQYPAVGLANRISPWLAGVPFLYGYLLIIYCLSILVLILAYRLDI